MCFLSFTNILFSLLQNHHIAMSRQEVGRKETDMGFKINLVSRISLKKLFFIYIIHLFLSTFSSINDDSYNSPFFHKFKKKTKQQVSVFPC